MLHFASASGGPGGSSLLAGLHGYAKILVGMGIGVGTLYLESELGEKLEWNDSYAWATYQGAHFDCDNLSAAS
jgi:hypothetical protein